MDARLRIDLIRTPRRRAQTRGEERANALSHGLGVLLALAAWPVLAEAAGGQSGRIGVAAVTVFCATMVLQYLASTVYHALPAGRAKLWARSFDHAAIFVFIAGSSTPFTLGLMPGASGAITCALVWVLALCGAALKLRRRLTNRRLSTGLYILLGWLALLAAWPGLQALDATALLWLLGGGLAYLVGTAFFVFDSSLRFGHFLWHLFVMAGSGCHVCAAVWPAFG
jgi:hemolysin III